MTTRIQHVRAMISGLETIVQRLSQGATSATITVGGHTMSYSFSQLGVVRDLLADYYDQLAGMGQDRANPLSRFAGIGLHIT